MLYFDMCENSGSNVVEWGFFFKFVIGLVFYAQYYEVHVFKEIKIIGFGLAKYEKVKILRLKLEK